MSNLTAQELIYKQMISDTIDSDTSIKEYISQCDEPEQYEDLWGHLKSEFVDCYDIEYEMREGLETNLKSKTSSRHYEIDVHAMKVDGVWVAWDYYYGGGKHGEPEAFDWISNARIVDCEEKVVTKVEYKFKDIV